MWGWKMIVISCFKFNKDYFSDEELQNIYTHDFENSDLRENDKIVLTPKNFNTDSIVIGVVEENADKSVFIECNSNYSRISDLLKITKSLGVELRANIPEPQRLVLER